MLTDSEDGLKYHFQRNHIEAEFKVSNLDVVCGASIHNYFTHIVLRCEQQSYFVSSLIFRITKYMQSCLFL